MIRHLRFPNRKPTPGVESHEICIRGREEKPSAEYGYTAVHFGAVVRIDRLSAVLVLPDDAAGARIQCEHTPEDTGGVHDAVHHERGRLHWPATGHLPSPACLQVEHIGGGDLLQGRVVSSLIITPIGEPVVRLAMGIADALVFQATGEGLGCNRGQIADAQCLKKSDEVFNFRGGKAAPVIIRHQGLLFVTHICQHFLVQQMELLRRVHHLQREAVLVPPQAADLSPIARLDYDNVALAAFASIRVENSVSEGLCSPAADHRKVRPQPAPTAVYPMTGRARAFAEENSSSGGGVSGDIFGRGRCAEAPDVAHQLPDFGSKHVKPRHLAAGNAVANILKDLCVLRTVEKVASRQRWSAPATRVTTVADLAGLLKQFLAGSDGFRIACHRISLWQALPLREGLYR